MLLGCWYTDVTLLLRWCYTVVTLLLHCCYTVVTLLLHCYYTVITLLLHCYYIVVTLFLHEIITHSIELKIQWHEDATITYARKGYYKTNAERVRWKAMGAVVKT
jgi:hypothetical protein